DVELLAEVLQHPLPLLLTGVSGPQAGVIPEPSSNHLGEASEVTHQDQEILVLVGSQDLLEGIDLGRLAILLEVDVLHQALLLALLGDERLLDHTLDVRDTQRDLPEPHTLGHREFSHRDATIGEEHQHVLLHLVVDLGLCRREFHVADLLLHAHVQREFVSEVAGQRLDERTVLTLTLHALACERVELDVAPASSPAPERTVNQVGPQPAGHCPHPGELVAARGAGHRDPPLCLCGHEGPVPDALSIGHIMHLIVDKNGQLSALPFLSTEHCMPNDIDTRLTIQEHFIMLLTCLLGVNSVHIERDFLPLDCLFPPDKCTERSDNKHGLGGGKTLDNLSADKRLAGAHCVSNKRSLRRLVKNLSDSFLLDFCRNQHSIPPYSRSIFYWISACEAGLTYFHVLPMRIFQIADVDTPNCLAKSVIVRFLVFRRFLISAT